MLYLKITKVVFKENKTFQIAIYHTLGSIPTYNLFGISNHNGIIYTGHYTAQCKHPFMNEWLEFNDLNACLISDISTIISPNAYVLFYERNKFSKYGSIYSRRQV